MQVLTAQSTSAITTDGKAFVNKEGQRFMVRGIALSAAVQTNGTDDLLADTNHEYFKSIILPKLLDLNVNTIRVYQVNINHSHSKTMDLLAKNGIYVMVGLVNPQISINRMNPSYSLPLYQRGTGVIDEFSRYENTFAFSVGNEVIFPGEMYAILKKEKVKNPGSSAAAIELRCAAVAKSFIRDMKAYISTKGYRKIPIGIAMQDGPQSSVADPNLIGTNVVAKYYASGQQHERADYIGINTYRYVNSATKPGPMNAYDGLAEEVKKLSIPVFLTESGGLNIGAGTTVPDSTRDWKIVSHLFETSSLYDQLSGQIAFEFFEKRAYHGLFVQSTDTSKALETFSYGPNNQYDGGFSNLADQFDSVEGLEIPIPATVATPSAPTNCDPALLPCPAPTTKVKVENYADKELKVVQGGQVMGSLPPGSVDSPTATELLVNGIDNIHIQYEASPSDWEEVCQVKATSIKQGLVIKNNVSWSSGGYCNIS